MGVHKGLSDPQAQFLVAADIGTTNLSSAFA